jgi:hypothetical protein
MPIGQAADSVVTQQLGSLLDAIENDFQADALTYVGPIVYGADDRIKEALESCASEKSGSSLSSKPTVGMLR